MNTSIIDYAVPQFQWANVIADLITISTGHYYLYTKYVVNVMWGRPSTDLVESRLQLGPPISRAGQR